MNLRFWKRKKEKILTDDEYLNAVHADCFKAALELDKKRRQDFIV